MTQILFSFVQTFHLIESNKSGKKDAENDEKGFYYDSEHDRMRFVARRKIQVSIYSLALAIE